jgi:FK506-binding protein 2
MRLPTLILVLTATLLPLVSAVPEGLDIKVTREVECTRKTVKGDKVDMHYRGTLASDGSEFDASYKRGQPLNFELGAGRVIKGWGEQEVFIPFVLSLLSLPCPALNIVLGGCSL